MAEWQPIETAPQMRTVLLWAVTSIDPPNWKMATGYWRCLSNFWSDSTEQNGVWVWEGSTLAPYDTQPTHWMPLPEPPTP